MNEEIKLKLYLKIRKNADRNGFISRKKALAIIGLSFSSIKIEILDELIKQGFINPLNKKIILDSIINMGLIEIVNRDKLRVVKDAENNRRS